MRNLKGKTQAALKTIHQLRNKERVSLKDIYDEAKLENEDSGKLVVSAVKNFI